MRIRVDSGFDWLADRLLPPRCVLCEGRGQAPGLDLCLPCEGDLPASADCCPRCALPRGPADGDGDCLRCRLQPPPYERCHAAFAYQFPLDGLIRALKYDGRLAVGRVLGGLLARSVGRRGLHLDVDLLLPVPLHPEKLAERGFNQSIEIAGWVARELGRPCESQALRRVRPTRPQVGLRLAERAANLRGAFAVARPLSHRRLVLIDDVVTTGSTVREIAAMLLAAGAASVDVWCVARTPE